MKRANFGRNLAAISGAVLFPKLPTTYLDTNALSDLSRLRNPAGKIPGIEQVRRDLCSFAAKRTIAVGQWLFSEMAGFENGDGRADFLADMAFVSQLQFLQIFRSSADMRRREVVAFLQRGELNPVIATSLPSLHDDTTLWAEERRQLAELKTEYLIWEDGATQRMEANYPDGEERAQRLAEDWNADRHGIVARWVRKQMGVQRDSLGLPPQQNLWPPPEKIPTFWCDWAYRVTRDLMRSMSPVIMKRRGSERRGSHAVDWCHFMTAAHADEFVTSDQGFLEIALAAPGPKPEILSLEDWVLRLHGEGLNRQI